MASSTPLHSHRCTLPNRTLWFGEASLYDDRIVIRGWTWRGRHHQEVLVEDIEEVDWRPRPEKPNLILYLDDGDAVELRLRKGAGLWNAKLHDLIGESLLDNRNLPENGHTERKDEQEKGEDPETT